jgi:hypothetical protein
MHPGWIFHWNIEPCLNSRWMFFCLFHGVPDRQLQIGIDAELIGADCDNVLSQQISGPETKAHGEVRARITCHFQSQVSWVMDVISNAQSTSALCIQDFLNQLMIHVKPIPMGISYALLFVHTDMERIRSRRTFWLNMKWWWNRSCPAVTWLGTRKWNSRYSGSIT